MKVFKFSVYLLLFQVNLKLETVENFKKNEDDGKNNNLNQFIYSQILKSFDNDKQKLDENYFKSFYGLCGTAYAFLEEGKNKKNKKIISDNNKNTFEKLNFLKLIIEKIKRTETCFGEYFLIKNIFKVDADLFKIQKKIDLIKYLFDKKIQFNYLKNLTKNLKDGADRLGLILYYDSNFNLKNKNKKNYNLLGIPIGTLENKIFKKIDPGYLKKGIDLLDESLYYGYFSSIVKNIPYLVVPIIEPLYQSFLEKSLGEKKNFSLILQENIKKYFVPFSNNDPKEVAYGILNTARSAATTTVFFVERIAMIKKELDNTFELNKSLFEIAKFFRKIRIISNFISKNTELIKIFPENKKLLNLFNKNKNISSDLEKFINYILSNTFKGNEPSYWITNHVKVSIVYNLLIKIRYELVPYLKAVGKIDNKIATVKLYEEFQKEENLKFNLIELIKSESPSILAEKYWHPYINKNNVITNTIEIGTNKNNKNLIVTGPNAGGKTTNLIAIIIAVLIGQGLGIAPAEKLIFTPFSEFNIYADIRTDIENKESLFQAEVNRATELKECLEKNFKENKKVLSFIDEIFNGTAVDVAESLAYDFIKNLNFFTNSLNLITTHFKNISKLENIQGFINYQVAAPEEVNGKLIYSFKLIPGVSNVNIARKIVEKSNILKINLK